MAKLFSLIQVLFPACLFSLFFLPPLSSADQSEISVVVSSHSRPFVEALDGFRSHFNQPVSINYVDSNPELAKHRVSHGTFNLIVAIGPAAAEIVWSNADPATPKLVLMVLDPGELLKTQAPLCGVHLRIPFEDQFHQINKRLGPGRRVGVLYTPEENGTRILQARESAAESDIIFVPMEVHKRGDVVSALTKAKGFIDTLLFIPDSTVISETMVAYLIKKTLLDGIAPVGYNHFFIEVGGVLSLNINYEKVGYEGAELASERLAGSECKLLSPPFEVEWNQKAWDFVNKEAKTP
ncbi:MAG: hypothetical protein KQH63_18340 [Desulfobulbaceae bacterium]|nr:hypothetical protein [Desulfobulbaceae bacterium]